MLGGGELRDGLRCKGAGMGAEQLGQREWEEDIVWPSVPEQDGNRLPSRPPLCMRPLCATNILPDEESSLKHDKDDEKDDKDEEDSDLWWLL